jgi:voltage-gated potassium channel
MKERDKYILAACAIFLAESVALYLFEQGSNKNLTSINDAMWWIVIFLSSGFEVTPETIGGKVVATLLVVEGLALLGFIFGGFAAHFVEQSLSGGKIMNQVKFKDHIVVCGWTSDTPRILDELTSEDVKTKQC